MFINNNKNKIGWLTHVSNAFGGMQAARPVPMKIVGGIGMLASGDIVGHWSDEFGHHMESIIFIFLYFMFFILYLYILYYILLFSSIFNIIFCTWRIVFDV